MNHWTHILCTRSLDAVLVAQAAEKNIRIDTLSFIATEPIRDETCRIQALGSTPLTAVFTSRNAVEAVAGHLTPIDPDPSGPPASPSTRSVPWKIFCIGSATRQLVEEHFGAAVLAGVAPSAAELADMLLQQQGQTPSEVFFFCGDQRREELPAKLTTAGVKVHELIVYHTTRTPQVIKDVYDGIAFFSPSAVHSFFQANTLPPTTTLFAIGKTTADTIRTYSNNSVITSTAPEQATLIRHIIDHFQKHI